MSRFHFRQQALLDEAAQRERGIQIELVRLQLAEAQARRCLDHTMRLWSEWDAEIRRSQQGRIEPRVLRELLHATETLRRRAAGEREQLRAAERQVEAVRDRLKEAATARKSYERLRERLHAEYQVEDGRRQVKTADDAASVRVATARMAGAALEAAAHRDRADLSGDRPRLVAAEFRQPGESGLTTGVPA